MRRAIESQRTFNVIHSETAFNVDCVIRKSDVFQKKIFDRRKVVDFYGKEIFIITAEDLVLSKLSWAAESRSDNQKADIKNLIRNPLDTKYIETWADRLGVKETYDSYREEVEL